MAPFRRRDPMVPPVYWQERPNEPIELGTARIEFDCEGQRHQATARAFLQLVPDHRLRFVVPLEAFDQPTMLKLGIGLADNWDGKLRLLDRGATIDAVYSGFGGDRGAMAFAPSHSIVTVTPPSSGLRCAVFHCFNLPNFMKGDDYFFEDGEPPRVGATLCGCVVLRAGGWRITLAATAKTRDIVKVLEDTGGFAITHAGSVEREDGQSFGSSQLEEVLSCLHHFLSFAMGRWTGIALSIGLDESGKRVYEQWGSWGMDSGAWKGGFSWFDKMHAHLLSEVFPGFFSLWNAPQWREPLCETMYWYLSANQPSLSVGIILAQTALELLAWTHCVEQQRMVSAAAFGQRGLRAADKLRLLTTSLGIPTQIPPALISLETTPGQAWTDGPDAITGVRNKLVHPSDRKAKLPDDAEYDTWRLSMWYLDMVLLRLCGHVGKYSNRLVRTFAGTVEQVPWGS